MSTRTSVELTMPQMGDSVTEGTVLEWHKEVGERVEADEVVVEISTDKVDAEVPSPVAGVITEILAQPDEVVAVGAVLAIIEAGGEAPAGDAPRPGAEDEPGSGNGADPVGSAGETVDVTFPEMGDSVAEGTILEWHKEVGDSVEVDDGLVEISTDKVDAEVPSPVAGRITEILVKPDEVVPVGAVLCRIAAGAPAASGLSLIHI